MGTSKTCLLFITLQLASIVTAQEMIKRVPTGFVGMRGKKYIDEDNPEQFYKRKPQFFVGVKGKKSIFDYLDASDDTIKRAPMGFMGMRGKKESYPDLFLEDTEYPKRDGSLIGQIDYTANENLNEPFPLLNQLLTEYLMKAERPQELDDEINETNERISNEIGKRAANIHQFFGVRGKKSIQNKRPYDLTFRGKFIGVRGKKDVKNSDTQEIKFLVDNGPLPKRKGQMGFIGMRGKKWSDDSSLEMETPN